MNPLVNTANNKLTGTTYDAAGNAITDAEGRQFTYDAENKQVEVENGSSQLIGQYYFDGDGKRVKKVVPSGETTIFVYDASGRLIGEYSTEVQPTQDAKTQYLTADHLGTPRINTNSVGAVVSRSDYMPYGEEIIGLGGRTSAEKYVADDVRQGFTGYENDDETDLEYAQARMYANGLGRFSSSDPLQSSARIENPQTWGRYTYVLNNPLVYVDPFGLYEWAVSAGGTATDEELLARSKDKTLKGKDRDLAKKQYEFRQEFKKGLEAAKVAANDPRLTPQQQAEAQRAVNAYGDYQKSDNVSVGIVASKGGTPNVAFGADDGKIHVDLNLNLTNRNSTITIAHEGSHIADFKELVAARGTAGESAADVDGYTTERRAYFVSSYMAQALNESPYYPETKGDGSRQIWNKGWKTKDIEEKRSRGVTNYNGWSSNNRGPKISTQKNTRY